MLHAAAEVGAWILRRRRRVGVTGNSMLPTLVGGEFVLIDPFATPSIGDLVVANHPSRDLVIIKRVGAGGPPIWLVSDNPQEGTDSSTFGPISDDKLIGVVTLVLNRPLSQLASPECLQ